MKIKNVAAIVGGAALVGAGALVSTMPSAWAGGSGDSPNIQFTQPVVPAMSTGATNTVAVTTVVNAADTTLATASASPSVKATH